MSKRQFNTKNIMIYLINVIKKRTTPVFPSLTSGVV